MFGSNDSNTRTLQAIHKLKQYVDATYQLIQTQGSASMKEDHEEAHAWRDELGQELDEITYG